MEDQYAKNYSLNALFGVNCKIIVRASEVKAQAFGDDTIRTLKFGFIVTLDQILRDLNKPTVEKLKRWAAGDGGASDTTNPNEEFDLWDIHALYPRVYIHHDHKSDKIMMMMSYC